MFPPKNAHRDHVIREVPKYGTLVFTPEGWLAEIHVNYLKEHHVIRERHDDPYYIKAKGPYINIKYQVGTDGNRKVYSVNLFTGRFAELCKELDASCPVGCLPSELDYYDLLVFEEVEIPYTHEGRHYVHRFAYKMTPPTAYVSQQSTRHKF